MQLGIIGPAGPLIGVGPGAVEDVFPLAVGLQIERHDRGDAAGLVLDRDVPRPPTGALDGAVRLLKNVEEVERYERIILIF